MTIEPWWIRCRQPQRSRLFLLLYLPRCYRLWHRTSLAYGLIKKVNDFAAGIHTRHAIRYTIHWLGSVACVQINFTAQLELVLSYTTCAHSRWAFLSAQMERFEGSRHEQACLPLFFQVDHIWPVRPHIQPSNISHEVFGIIKVFMRKGLHRGQD